MSNTAQQRDYPALLKKALIELREMKKKLQRAEQTAAEPVAIIGMGCRLPGGIRNPAEFWEFLRNGRNGVVEVPECRWEKDAYYSPDADAAGKTNAWYGGFLDAVDAFDPQFFGISPKEATSMDPQQRLVLEVGWEALEDACCPADRLSGSATGVFVGIGSFDYGASLLGPGGAVERIDAYFGTGSALSVAAGRLSYVLGLTGPCMSVDTACSSSLLSVHLACQSLHNRECDLALAGGVNVLLAPECNVNFTKARMLAPDGRCKTFDASADGYVRGEGCGMIVLKRLSEAIADQDRILAVIRGSAVNQDGPSGGLTVPSGPAQSQLIQQALSRAGVAPGQVNYIEVHGTGTALGDPIEVGALADVFAAHHNPDKPLFIGSVKTNIGHLEAGAGIAGLIKTVLALHQRTIPPHLHFKEPNPHIDWDALPFRVPVKRSPWPPAAGKRCAGVSSFGFSGTNVHVVLEESPADEGADAGVDSLQPPSGCCILALSAKTDEALHQLAQRYQAYLSTHTTWSLADICYSANAGRSHFHRRLCVIGSTPQQMCTQLAAFDNGNKPIRFVSDASQAHQTPKIAFIFSGQDGECAGLGKVLFETQAAFRTALLRCNEITSDYLEISLVDWLYSEEPDSRHSEDVQSATVALFSLQYALSEHWRSYGVLPATVFGYGVGEYAAACCAGILSLDDAVHLVVEHARLIACDASAKSAVVYATERQLRTSVDPDALDVRIVGHIAPNKLVVGGESDGVDALLSALSGCGIRTETIANCLPFPSQSKHQTPGVFESVAAAINYAEPRCAVASALTGETVGVEVAWTEYWRKRLRGPIQFAAAMKTLYEQGNTLFVELGPRSSISEMVRRCVPDTVAASQGLPIEWLSGLERTESESRQLLERLAALYVHGVPVDWGGLRVNSACRKVSVPTYPFQRQSYWLERVERQTSGSTPSVNESPLIEDLRNGAIQEAVERLKKTEALEDAEARVLPEVLKMIARQLGGKQTVRTVSELFYQEQWQALSDDERLILPEEAAADFAAGAWLILADHGSTGTAVTKRWSDEQRECVVAYAGRCYQPNADGTFTVNPSEPDDLERLLRDGLGSVTAAQTPEGRRTWSGVVHLWSLDSAVRGEAITADDCLSEQECGAFSVISLIQALSRLNDTPPPRLFLVTRGTQSIAGVETNVLHAALWGVARVIANEHPEYQCTRIDLSDEPGTEEIDRLLRTLSTSGDEPELGLRGDQVFVPRLCPIADGDVVARTTCKVVGAQMQSVSTDDAECPRNGRVVPDATYLITGGYGTLGLVVANWLIPQGATNLILLGRGGPSESAQAVIDKMSGSGVQVHVVRADVSRCEDLDSLISRINASMPPLRGIFHLAGVLDDCSVLNVCRERFDNVMRVKVQGAWNLHTLSLKQDLDVFVLFSSGSSLLGSPGQCSYVAANAVLDALAHYRKRMNRASLSINLGRVAQTGFSQSLSKQAMRFALAGGNSISKEDFRTALERVIDQGLVQVGILAFDLDKWREHYPWAGSNPYFSFLNKHAPVSPAANASITDRFADLSSSSDRLVLIENELKAIIADELKFPSDEMDVHLPFENMGIDSLLAILVKNRVAKRFDQDISVTTLWTYPTINKYASYLAELIAPKEDTVTDASIDQAEPIADEDLQKISSELERKLEKY